MDKEDRKDIVRVLGGQIEAFEAIIVRNQPYLTKVIAGMIPSSEVDEVTQMTFVEAFEKLACYRGDKPFRHWLLRIGVNKSNDFWRDNKRQLRKKQKLSGEIELNLQLSVNDLRSESLELLDLLAPKDRLLLSCLYLEDMSIEDTAKFLGWGVSNVKVRAFRAKRKLKSLIIASKWTLGG